MDKQESYKIVESIISSKIEDESYKEVLSILLNKSFLADTNGLEKIGGKDTRILQESVLDLQYVLGAKNNSPAIKKIIDEMYNYASLGTYKKYYIQMIKHYNKKFLKSLLLKDGDHKDTSKNLLDKRNLYSDVNPGKNEYVTIDRIKAIKGDEEVPLYTLFANEPFFFNDIDGYAYFSNVVDISHSDDKLYVIKLGQEGKDKSKKFRYINLEKGLLSKKYDMISGIEEDSEGTMFFTGFTMCRFTKEQVTEYIEGLYHRDALIDYNKGLEYTSDHIIQRIVTIILELLVDCVDPNGTNEKVYSLIYSNYGLDGDNFGLDGYSEDIIKGTVSTILLEEVATYYYDMRTEKTDALFLDFFDGYTNESLFDTEKRDIDEKVLSLLQELLYKTLKKRNIPFKMTLTEKIDISNFSKYQEPKAEQENKDEVVRYSEIMALQSIESELLRKDFSLLLRGYKDDIDLFGIEKLLATISVDNIYVYFEDELELTDSQVTLFKNCVMNLKTYIANFTSEGSQQSKNILEAGCGYIDEIACLYELYVSYMYTQSPEKVTILGTLCARYIDKEEINGTVYNRFNHINYNTGDLRSSMVCFETKLLIDSEYLLKKIEDTDTTSTYGILVSPLDDFNKEFLDIIASKYDENTFSSVMSQKSFESHFMNLFLECVYEIFGVNISYKDFFYTMEMEGKNIGTIGQDQTIYEYLQQEIHLMVSDDNNGGVHSLFSELFEQKGYEYDVFSDFIYNTVYRLYIVLLQSVGFSSRTLGTITLQ